MNNPYKGIHIRAWHMNKLLEMNRCVPIASVRLHSNSFDAKEEQGKLSEFGDVLMAYSSLC